MAQPKAAAAAKVPIVGHPRVVGALPVVLGPAHQLAVQQTVQQPVGGGVHVGQRVDAVHDVDELVRAEFVDKIENF